MRFFAPRDKSLKPIELSFMRHAQSEPNVMQQAEKSNEDVSHLTAFYSRHDSNQRLSAQGREQVVQARRWMLENDLDPDEYDARVVSPYGRTLETAYGLGTPDTLWAPEPKLIERDWGYYGSTPRSERPDRFPEVEAATAMSTFYARLAGGESPYDTTSRVQQFIGRAEHKYPRKRVLVVTHGEVMWVTRFCIERMLPHEWEAMDEDKTLRLTNCTFLQFRRTDPLDPTHIVPSLSMGWRRITDTLNPSRSPYGGLWVRLSGRRTITGREMLSIVERHPNLLEQR